MKIKCTEMTIAIICSAFLFLAVFVSVSAATYFDQRMYELKTERNLKEWELKTRIEEARASQAELRVKELEMLCSMTTKSGEVYLDKDC